MRRLAIMAVVAFSAAAWAGEGAVRAVRCVGDTCWAAGDGGLVLRSEDGGATWTTVAGAEGNLQAIVAGGEREVCFAGGRGVAGQPYGAGLPVLYRTRPGAPGLETMPPPPGGWLYGAVIDGDVMITYGQATPRCPSGTWRSTSGGKLWVPVEGESSGTLLAGAFRSTRSGFLVGRQRRIVAMRDMQAVRVPPPADKIDLSLRAAVLDSRGRCWCAGDNAALLRTDPGEEAFRTMLAPLPAGTRRLADFAALAVDGGDRIWLGGGLTGLIFCSDNGGEKWQALPAPGPGPLHSLAWIAGDVVLAAGDAGRIWRSQDAGATWKLVHGAAATDVLFILSPADLTPWPAVVAHARAGLSVAVAFATCPSAPYTAPEQPLRAAAVEAGAGGATVLTELPSAAGQDEADLNEELLLRRWSDLLETPAEPVMIQQLAAAIRLYRPAVVAVGPSHSGYIGPAAETHLVSRLAQQAVALAADGQAKPLALAGLAPWTASRTVTGREENTQWAAPWQDEVRPRPEGVVAEFDQAEFPAGAGQSLEMLAQRAIWQLPWTNLLSRSNRYSAYECPSVSTRGPLFTAGLSDKSLSWQDGEPAQVALATMVDLRMAAKMDRLATVFPDLQDALQKAAAANAAILPADRMMLLWQRLLEQGDFVRAETARQAVLACGAGHPLFSSMNVLALAQEVSCEYQAQRLLAGPHEPMPPEALRKAAGSFAAWGVWSQTPEGRILLAKAMMKLQLFDAAQATLRQLDSAGYGREWRDRAALELSLLGAGKLPLLAVAAARLADEAGKLDGKLDEKAWTTAPKAVLTSKDGKLLPATQPATSQPADKVGGEGKGDRHLFRKPEKQPVPFSQPVPSFQILAAPTGQIVFAVTLPKAEGRAWELTLAIDADRDAWTQLVLYCDTIARRWAELRTLGAPAVRLPAGAFDVQAVAGEANWTFEIVIHLRQVAPAPPAPTPWAFQLRATAVEGNDRSDFFFQPQDDARLLPQRYGLLEIPVAK